MRLGMGMSVILLLLSSGYCWAEERMEAKNTQILVVYGTFGGTTTTIAESFKHTLTAQNCNVDIMEAVDKERQLDHYDMVIIGSAIRGNQPHESIRHFIEKNKSALEKKPVAVFAACCTISSRKESKRKNALTYPITIAHGLKPVSEAVFASDIPSGGWFGDFMGDIFLGVKPGKYRDWEKINQWAISLPDLVLTGHSNNR